MSYSVKVAVSFLPWTFQPVSSSLFRIELMPVVRFGIKVLDNKPLQFVYSSTHIQYSTTHGKTKNKPPRKPIGVVTKT